MKDLIIDTHALEFGQELILILPIVYQHHIEGNNPKVITNKGMRCFYYFLPEDSVIEKYQQRTDLTNQLYGNVHKAELEHEMFPDYTSHFKNKTLKHKFDKKIIIVNNKYNTEWGHEPVNFIDLHTLSEIFETLSPNHSIVYNRPRSNKIPPDNSHVYDLGDYELISEKFPEVIDINELEEDYSFNELQLILGAKSIGQISVQGGGSVLSSFTGGFNYIYAVKGGELNLNTFKLWYHKFSNCKIKTFSSYKDILDEIKNLN